MRFHFTTREVLDLAISAIILTLAFWILWNGTVGPVEIIAGVTTGFILHELAHKIVAQKMRYEAHYHMWIAGAIAAIVTAFLGFIFAAPGAVRIGSRIDLWGRRFAKRREIGIIGLAGPATNIILALVLIAVGLYYTPLQYAIFINLFLAAFNMIPFGPLDGYKVKEWSWWIWGATFATIILIGLSYSKFI